MEKNEINDDVITFDFTPRDVSIDFVSPDIRVKKKVEDQHVGSDLF